MLLIPHSEVHSITNHYQNAPFTVTTYYIVKCFSDSNTRKAREHGYYQVNGSSSPLLFILQPAQSTTTAKHTINLHIPLRHRMW